MGLSTDCLLMVNNYRDVNQDALSGKRTFVLRLDGRELNRVLGLTARNILVFGILTSAAIILSFAI